MDSHLSLNLFFKSYNRLRLYLKSTIVPSTNPLRHCNYDMCEKWAKNLHYYTIKFILKTKSFKRKQFYKPVIKNKVILQFRVALSAGSGVLA